MKTNLLLFLSIITAGFSAPRPDYFGLTNDCYLIQQVWLDGSGGFIDAPTTIVRAPWDGSDYVFGIYVFDTSTGTMNGAHLASGSGISYNNATELLTFGINDAVQSALDAKASTASLSGYATTAALALKFNIPAGTTAQYLRGDGSVATFPTAVSAFTNDSAYINQAGARTAIALTTTGTSGAATYNNSTGALNVPQYANSGGTVTSVTAGAGLSGGAITTTGTISLPNTGSAGTYSGITTDAQGRVTAGTARSFTNAASKTLVTSPTGQGGVVLNASRDAEVHYSVATSTTATIGGASTVTIYLEIAATNSATAGDWSTLGKIANGQTISLALALQSVQTSTLTIGAIIPAGQYVRLRSAVTGTASATYDSGQEVLL